MKVQTTRESAFTLVEIMIVVAIIGLLSAVAVPNILRARYTAQKNACIANLKQIEGAIQQWGMENKKSAGTTVVTTDVIPYLKSNVMPQEPTGGSYEVSTIDAPPTCSQSGIGHTL